MNDEADHPHDVPKRDDPPRWDFPPRPPDDEPREDDLGGC